MKKALMIIFGFVAFWDAFTTLIGTSGILGRDSLAISIIATIVIGAFMVGTKFIWRQNGSLKTILVIIWFIALFYDVATSYIGNLEYALNGRANQEQELFLWGITIMTSASPILVSILIDE